MNYKQIREERLGAIGAYAKRIWEILIPQMEEWNETAPLFSVFNNFPFVSKADVYWEDINVVVWGSGSFSTGRMELEQWKKAKREIPKLPIEYVAVVSNNKESNAKDVAEKFGLSLVEIDFNDWYRENYGKSRSPIKETGLFFPPGSELPDDIEHRFEVREKFEYELLDLLVEEADVYIDGVVSNSLRGFNFPIIHSYDKWFFDDTHPADLSYVDENGDPLYPGWQSGATKKMIEDGHEAFRSSLIWVHPIGDVKNIQSVDAGELLALSEGIKYKGKNAKELQNIMKITEDSMLVALKAWGLFPLLWSYTTDKVKVPYKTLDDKMVWRREHSIIVGKRERSGARAFGGQNFRLHLENLLADVKSLK
ncbi:MAG: hypothetical protein J7K73_04155 [Nanoarchaeota archaeon]|nr:hypothetical protein [Nanoarchaeota archaeon]